MFPFLMRDLAQQHGVRDAENRRRRADAQGEDHQDGEREAARPLHTGFESLTAIRCNRDGFPGLIGFKSPAVGSGFAQR
jgi:hypothetical protein